MVHTDETTHGVPVDASGAFAQLETLLFASGVDVLHGVVPSEGHVRWGTGFVMPGVSTAEALQYALSRVVASVVAQGAVQIAGLSVSVGVVSVVSNTVWVGVSYACVPAV